MLPDLLPQGNFSHWLCWTFLYTYHKVTSERIIEMIFEQVLKCFFERIFKLIFKQISKRTSKLIAEHITKNILNRFPKIF